MEYIRGFIIIGVGGSLLISMLFSFLDYIHYLHNRAEEKRLKELDDAELKAAKRILSRSSKYLNQDGSINTLACKSRLEQVNKEIYKKNKKKLLEPQYVEFEVVM